MRTIAALCFAASTLFSLGAFAAELGSWTVYMKENRLKCPGPLDTLATPQLLTLAGKRYALKGFRLEIQEPDADNTVKLGVISAIKDVSEGTRANVADAIAWFKSAGVEWVVVNGDLALEEFDLEEVIEMLGQTGLPTLMTIGNSESRGSWARAYGDRAVKYPNLINGVWVRQIVADDVELWTLPGYHDKAFVRAGAGCIYAKEDTDLMIKELKPNGAAPLVLVAHGPPQGSGKTALDFIMDKKNVGDPMLNRLIDKMQIPFGLFGHILEAGGAAVGKDFSTPVPAGKLVDRLYINAGSVSGDPWGMLDGSSSWGMAFLVTLEGKQAKYELKRFKERE